MADIWNLTEEERIKVEVDKYGCPYTEEGAVLSSFLGVITKNGRYAPLDILDGIIKHLIHTKENCLSLLSIAFMFFIFILMSIHGKQSKFSYPIGTRDWVLASLNKKWRDYKSELKSEYFLPKEKSVNEIMANVPQDVIKDQ
uniref:Uncharacterized protein n=1 Tax=Ananas comosus var. bracteatus TaxID=296719 RepID=A0A6V7PGT1_ANACO|nr:unnamed protein product [Ananas comosus var. bracteatus]